MSVSDKGLICTVKRLSFFSKGTIDELILRYKLSEEQLAEQCSKDHLLDIGVFISWNEVGPRLEGIESIDMMDIRRNEYNEKQKREKLLQLWVERNGSKATYKAIITAMLKERKYSEAEKVCKLLPRKGKCNFYNIKLIIMKSLFLRLSHL